MHHCQEQTRRGGSEGGVARSEVGQQVLVLMSQLDVLDLQWLVH